MRIDNSPVFFVCLFLLTACNSWGESTESQTVALSTGLFIDSPVSGLGYKTPSRSGKTSKSGEFSYQTKERVKFFIGDIELGEALGRPEITPLTLVPEATNAAHPKVNNMVRLLMTLDKNGNPDDGIAISDEVVTASKGLKIDFSADDFAINPDLIKLLGSLSNQPELVSASAAQGHFSATLAAQSTWGMMMWGQGTWQDSDFLANASTWGLMEWGRGAWKNATNTDL